MTTPPLAELEREALPLRDEVRAHVEQALDSLVEALRLADVPERDQDGEWYGQRDALWGDATLLRQGLPSLLAKVARLEVDAAARSAIAALDLSPEVTEHLVAIRKELAEAYEGKVQRAEAERDEAREDARAAADITRASIVSWLRSEAKRFMTGYVLRNAADSVEVLEHATASAVIRERDEALAKLAALEARAVEAEKELAREDSAHCRTIDTLDRREAQINAIADALGDEGEWSNLHDRGQAALELAEAATARIARLQALLTETCNLAQHYVEHTLPMPRREADERLATIRKEIGR